MNKNKMGFTLVELLGVIVILVIVAGVVVTSAFSLVKSHNNEEYSILISEFEQAVKAYLNDNYENYVVGKSFNTFAVKLLYDNNCSKNYIKIDDLVRSSYIKESSLVDPRDNSTISKDKYIEVYYNNSDMTINSVFSDSNTITCSNITYNNGSYIFNSSNNYVLFNNQLFRIIKINKDGSIRLFADSNIGDSVFGKDGTYSSSYVLSSLQYWFIYDISAYSKELVREASLSLISDTEYNSLNANTKTNDEIWILQSGTTGITNLKDESIDYLTQFAYIRPVIELKPSVIYVGGDGSISNPYVIR